MTWVRGLGAVVAGFVAMAVVVMVATAVGSQMPGIVKDGAATPLWLVINLSYSLAAAVIGITGILAGAFWRDQRE